MCDDKDPSLIKECKRVITFLLSIFGIDSIILAQKFMEKSPESIRKATIEALVDLKIKKIIKSYN